MRERKQAARQRERHGDADHEHECRLDQVPEDQTLPGDVIEPARDAAPGGIPLQHREAKSFRREQQHDEAAIRIEREIASVFRRRLGACRRLG